MKFTVAVLLFIAKTSFADNYIDIYWREYNGTIPLDAVHTDTYPNTVYIAQVNGLTAYDYPGTLYPKEHIAITEVGDIKAVFNIPFKIMCTTQQYRLRWVYVNIATVTGAFLNKCVVGGHAERLPFYVGKVFHESVWKIGKVYHGGHIWEGLNLWENSGGPYTPKDFQILVFD